MTNFRLDDELLAALHRIKNRDGISVSEQVRRALVHWLESRGESLPPSQTKPSEDDMKNEKRVRARAGRRGYRVSKSRRAQSLDNLGLFMLADDRNYCVLGDRYDATLEEIDRYLDEQ